MTVDILNITSPQWMARATCAESFGGDLWFPDNASSVGRRSNQSLADQAERAMTVCNTICPVREQCLSFAREEGIDAGIWGGEWLDQPKLKRVNQNDGKTHCPKGHEYALRINKGKTWRRCTTCDREGIRARRAAA